MKMSCKTIWAKLVTAFSAVLFMIGLVSSVAFVTWGILDQKMDMMVDGSIPALTASYQLERNSAELQTYLNELDTTASLARLGQIHTDVDLELDQLNHTISTLETMTPTNQLAELYLLLNQDIQRYGLLLETKLNLAQERQKVTETILWLHQDLLDEITPLNQELEWQVTNSHNTSLSDKKLALLNKDFTVLQELRLQESKLIALVQEIIDQHPHRNLSSAFQFISYKIQELNALSNAMQHNAASIALSQLVAELADIVKPDGQLYQLLSQTKSTQSAVEQQKAAIKSRLSLQQEYIRQLVSETRRTLNHIQDDAKQTVRIGNHTLIAVLLCALLSSIFICTYFVRKRIVARLHDLSLALNAVVSGKKELAVSVSGQDEIGRLGQDLRNYLLQRQEMEKTNALNLINNTEASIITCTTRGCIESVNSRARELFPRLCADIMPSETIWALFAPHQQASLKAIFAEASPLLKDGAHSLTLGLGADGQQRYFRLDLRLYQQNNQPKVIITLTDITEQENIARWLEQKVEEKTLSLSASNAALQDEIEERKRAEADLVTTQDELIQAAKMAAVGQAMTTLAHELNQPLSALSTYIYTVQMTYDEEQYPAINDTMVKMDEICERMDRIIANLRSFSKKTSSTRPVTKTSLSIAAANAIEIAACRAKQHSIELHNELDRECHAFGEPIQIEQILVNLLLNSCDALAPQVETVGRVSIAEISRTDDCVTIACCDNGPGFDPDITHKIFTPFTTTKEVGLGLGLNICRSIMDRMNGSIRLASALNGGAMIILELPINAAN